MEHAEFIRQVQLNLLHNHTIRLSESETVVAIEAVLQTLAEQLTLDDRAQLAGQLPASVQDFWRDAGMSKSLTLEGFFERIAERESVSVRVATYYTRAVLGTLAATLSPEALERLRKEFPARFHPLFDRGDSEALDAAL